MHANVACVTSSGSAAPLGLATSVLARKARSVTLPVSPVTSNFTVTVPTAGGKVPSSSYSVSKQSLRAGVASSLVNAPANSSSAGQLL